MERILIRMFLCFAFLALAITAPANVERKQGMLTSKRSSKNDCKENLREFYLALGKYADFNNGKLPAKNNFAGLQELLKHGISLDNFYCQYYKGEKFKEKEKKKNDKNTAGKKSKKKDSFTEKNSAYVYFGGINMASSKNKVPKMIVMCDKFFDASSGHLRVLLIDGDIIEIKSNKPTESTKDGKQEKVTRGEKLEKLVDLIDYLAKKYKYPQDVHQILRNKAANIDAELKMKDKKTP